MKLNLDGINLDQFLKNNPQFSKKTETIILTDGKNEIEVSFSQTQEENIHIPPTEIIEKTFFFQEKNISIPSTEIIEKTSQQEKVNEALRLHKLWLQRERDGKQISPDNYPKHFFKGMDLTGSDLRNAVLESADLQCSNLSDNNLSCAILIGANLTSANLSCIVLYRSNLENANLSSTNLTGADLSRTNLTGANLEGANLEGANLEGANLTNCTINKYTYGISDELIQSFEIKVVVAE